MCQGLDGVTEASGLVGIFPLQATENWLESNSEYLFTSPRGFRVDQSGSPTVYQGPWIFPSVPVDSISMVAYPLVVAEWLQLLPSSPHVPISKP